MLAYEMMLDLNRQFIMLRWVLTCVLSLVILGQSMMTVADPHRLYQPLERHVEAGHEHPFELSMPLLTDKHQHGGHAAGASDEEDNKHCCHCHGSLHLFVVTDLNMPADAPHRAASEYGFPVSDPPLPRLARPPIA